MKQYAVVIPVFAKTCFMMQRKSKHHIGMWEFPAGKSDPGEDILDTAVREYFEETGAIVTHNDLQLLMTTYTSTLYSTLDHWKNNYYITKCKLIKSLSIAEPEIHSDAKWFNINDILQMRNAGVIVPTSSTVIEVLSQNI